MGDSRGSIAFFGTYRTPVPVDIFSRPVNPALNDEQLLTDGESYNHNGRQIPPAALKELLTFLRTRNKDGPKMGDATRGLIFVSERDNGLETLHVALSSDAMPTPRVLSLADVYGAGTFGGVRLEDRACFAGGFQAGGRAVGHSLIYVSTKEPVKARRTPWTVVYKTDLADGKTERLTPPEHYDLSPAVSPSGKMVAVANFQSQRWNGEIELLKTDIVIMNVDRQAQGGLRRKVLIKNGGWPTWGSDNFIFFHRGKPSTDPKNRLAVNWRVLRYDIAAGKEEPVTPENIDAMTPAAISETRVSVATIRKKSNQNVSVDPREKDQYRHIEIFDVTAPDRPVRITLKARGKADHYNPFVLDGGSRIGYHRCRTDKLRQNRTVLPRNFDRVHAPETHKDVGLFRVSGVSPSFSKDGSSLAFVDNEFQAVWVADKDGLDAIYKLDDANKVYSAAWNQNPAKNTLYVCVGPAFSRTVEVNICAITKDEETGKWLKPQRLTNANGKYNNAFPSSSPDGSMLVFKSTRDRVPGGDRMHTNLFIMEDADCGEWGEGELTQLTNGPWVDTHCSWSPSGDWIVFASSRDKDPDAPAGPLDAGYFSVYIVNAADRDPSGKTFPAPVRVVHSSDNFIGHVNHPVFSPDMRSLVFAADLAAVSVEPVSMPIFIHSVRPYGDIFSVDLRDKDDIAKNQDIREFHRLTHSRYEYSTPAWTTKFAGDDPNEQWNMLSNISKDYYAPACPYLHGKDAEGWHMAGHLTIPRRCC